MGICKLRNVIMQYAINIEYNDMQLNYVLTFLHALNINSAILFIIYGKICKVCTNVKIFAAMIVNF